MLHSARAAPAAADLHQQTPTPNRTRQGALREHQIGGSAPKPRAGRNPRVTALAVAGRSSVRRPACNDGARFGARRIPRSRLDRTLQASACTGASPSRLLHKPLAGPRAAAARAAPGSPPTPATPNAVQFRRRVSPCFFERGCRRRHPLAPSRGRRRLQWAGRIKLKPSIAKAPARYTFRYCRRAPILRSKGRPIWGGILNPISTSVTRSVPAQMPLPP